MNYCWKKQKEVKKVREKKNKRKSMSKIQLKKKEI